MKLVIAATLALLAFAQPSAPESRPNDHTIYSVQGSPSQLKEFRRSIGQAWAGGTFLDQAKDGTTARYWAFSDRTAPQAREFIFGTMQSGLQLEMEAYDERRFFPTERAELNSIAARCRFSVDPFLITPRRELLVHFEPSDRLQSVDCALAALKASNLLRELPTGIVGSEAAPERGK